ncbi:MAG: CBS domain-containing protein [Phycisphaeraceae bacterium]|nr:CBS domain-containing protein [Phycisphaeraceae bacterium]
MNQVRQILERKGSSIVSIRPHATVLEAAARMNEHQVGALVVQENERVVGMFTERDVLRRVVAERRDPAETTVDLVMTRDVICCRDSSDIDEARSLLMQKRIRHLPVLDDDDRLVGLISIGDLNAWQLDGHEIKIQHLEAYIYGRV